MSEAGVSAEFDKWLRQGIDNGWCGPAVCYTHDGLPASDTEIESLDDDDEPCLHIIRLYQSNEQRNQVERDHSPSQWRKPR